MNAADALRDRAAVAAPEVAARMREAARQQALLAAISGADLDRVATPLAESGARASVGVEAYVVNADKGAERALVSTFPTLHQLIGADDFARVAARFRRAHPPERGDLGEWGEHFPDWLRLEAGLAQWPYLGDCAALDLAVQRCERAADSVFDAASLALLQEGEPNRLHLRLMPGTAVLSSAWPVAAIHAAHHATAADFSLVREALGARRGESVLVVRAGWRARVQPIDATTLVWTRCLLDGLDLAAALERAGVAFDFAAWLAAALRGSWLQGVACRID